MYIIHMCYIHHLWSMLKEGFQLSVSDLDPEKSEPQLHLEANSSTQSTVTIILPLLFILLLLYYILKFITIVINYDHYWEVI